MCAVAAMKALRRTHPGSVLVVLGPTRSDDGYSDQFMAAVSRSGGAVHYMPPVPQAELVGVMRQADIMLNSSVSEGASNALLEAMQIGVPLLARRIPGNTAILEHNITALLFDTPEEMAAQAGRLLDSKALRDRLVSAARVLFEQKHSLAAEARAYSRLVHEAVHGRGRFVFLVGTAGVGKTTVADQLKARGWVHFCVDAWQSSLDPIADSGRLPNEQEQLRVDPGRKRLFEELAQGLFLPWLQGLPVEPGSWERFYEQALGEAAHRRGECVGKHFVVSHAAVTRAMRESARTWLGPEMEVVVLQADKQLLVDRKYARLQAVAAEQGMSVEQFMLNFKQQHPGIPGQGESFEEMLRFHTELPSKPSDPVGADERSTFAVQVTAEMQPEQVTTAVLAALDLYE